MKSKLRTNQSSSLKTHNNNYNKKNQRPSSVLEIDLSKSEEKTYTFKSYLFPIKNDENNETTKKHCDNSPMPVSQQSTAQTSRNRTLKNPMVIPNTSYFPIESTSINYRMKVNTQSISKADIIPKKEASRPKKVTHAKKQKKTLTITAIEIAPKIKQNQQLKLKSHSKARSLQLVTNNTMFKTKAK